MGTHRGAGMAIPLGRPLPGASCDRPERRRGGPPGIPRTRCLPLLLGLAPGGVFPAAAVAGGAVRSYRTVSPLPPAGGSGRTAVYFLWHFPWGRPRRALPGTAPPWSPDFPPSAQGGERPSGRLAQDHLGIGVEPVEAGVHGSGLSATPRPGTTTAMLLDDRFVEVAPLRVLLFDEPDLPIATPFFEFFLAADRGSQGRRRSRTRPSD